MQIEAQPINPFPDKQSEIEYSFWLTENFINQSINQLIKELNNDKTQSN